MEQLRKWIKEYAGFAVLLILYIAASVITPSLSRSPEMIRIGDAMLPVSALTGACSAIFNICVFFLVLYYRKTGFIISVILLFFIGTSFLFPYRQ